MDSPAEPQGGDGEQPPVAAAEDAAAPVIVLDSGSSTEVDEDDDDDSEGGRAADAPPRLPATWAFSQRAVDGGAASPSAARGGPMRRRVRYPEELFKDKYDVVYKPNTILSGFVVYYKLETLFQTGPQGALPQPDCSAL